MALLSVTKSVLFMALAFYLDTKDHRPLPIAPAYRTPDEVRAELDDDVCAEYDHVEVGKGSPRQLLNTLHHP